MNLKAIAIDDEPKALEVIKMHASKVPFLDLTACFTNAFDAIPYVKQHNIDLIFLDIKMPDISGIELVSCFTNPPMVIFTTAYSDYAVQGFELDAIDYLLKPFSLVRFTKSCNKALEAVSSRKEELKKFIFIKTGYEEEKVYLSDILYLEAEGNYISFVLEEKKHLCRQSLNEVSAILPENSFIRIHRSYVIALNKIEKISRHEITINGVALPIGASYQEKINEIRQKLNISPKS